MHKAYVATGHSLNNLDVITCSLLTKPLISTESSVTKYKFKEPLHLHDVIVTLPFVVEWMNNVTVFRWYIIKMPSVLIKNYVGATMHNYSRLQYNVSSYIWWPGNL